MTRPIQCDPYKRLSAAVIKSAMHAYVKGSQACLSAREKSLDQRYAERFLQGDMFPWAETINIDPETDLSFRRWCQKHGLVAGKLIGEKV